MAFILGVILLAFAMQPCADNYAAVGGHIQETHESHAHENQGVAGDLCNPLCVCGCCGTPVIVKFSLRYGAASPAPLPQRQYPVYRFTFTPSYIQNIWQPPKINA